MEQQFKGNYLLLATVDGQELKFIIRKGTSDHDVLSRTGLTNVTDEMKNELIGRFLLPKIGSEAKQC